MPHDGEVADIYTVVMDDGAGCISVALARVPLPRSADHLMMALRWNEGSQSVAPWQSYHGWFLIPFTFARSIAKSVIELHAAGHPSIRPDGFAAMLSWLDEVEGYDSAMCY